jgi:hypothetical protein
LTPGATYYSSGRTVYISTTAAGTVGTGTSHNFVVPAGITQIRVQMAGGGGGSHVDGGSGACGGFVVGELGVTPGETITVFAGAGGQGYSTATNPRGGTGSYIARGATVLGGAGGGGGSGRPGSTANGNGGGFAYGLTLNGGDGTTGGGGASGNNYVEYLANSLAFIGKNSVGGTINQAGVSARYFTSLYNGGTNYGFGGNLGGNGIRGVVIVEW